MGRQRRLAIQATLKIDFNNPCKNDSQSSASLSRLTEQALSAQATQLFESTQPAQPAQSTQAWEAQPAVWFWFLFPRGGLPAGIETQIKLADQSAWWVGLVGQLIGLASWAGWLAGWQRLATAATATGCSLAAPGIVCILQAFECELQPASLAR